MAHRAAALGAIEAAQDRPSFGGPGRAAAVLAERVTNGLWRLGLDAAKATGRAPRTDLLLKARAAARAIGSAAKDAGALAVLAQAVDAMAEEAHAFEDAVHASLPQRVDLAALLARATGDPEYALGKLALLQADVLDPLRHAGQGGSVETSRGMLHHRCEIEAGVITAYRIDAPTDRIVAGAHGELASAMAGLPHQGDPLRVARLVCTLHDPCDALTFTLKEAGHA